MLSDQHEICLRSDNGKVRGLVVNHNDQQNAGEAQSESSQTIHATVAVTGEPGSMNISATVWDISTFAPDWFAEALAEARNGGGPQARRREILFAVCCAESYLFEWIRDEVLKRDFSKLSTYFKPRTRDNVLTKWKEVPKQHAQEKLIDDAPHFHNWGEFGAHPLIL